MYIYMKIGCMAISDTLHFFEMPLRPWTSDSKRHTYIYTYIHTRTNIEMGYMAT